MTLQPHSKLGQYEIVEKVGAGGMGAVYKGYQTALGRFVAIKVLPPQTAGDPAFAERFAQEARAIGKLRHPNIVTAFDFANDAGVAFLVSEFIDGGTLADQLGAPLPIDYTISTLSPIAAALDYAHARGVVHRDIKPQNVLLTHDGTPVLTDFGLAKIVGPGSGITQAGSLMGTAEYIAPECAAGVEAAGPAADQYALGLIAYQMLTGQHPFPADNPLSALMAHVHKPVPLPSSLGVALAPGVEAALLKVLAKRPEERFARSGDFVRALAGSAFIAAPPITRTATTTPPAPAPQPSEPQASPLLSASALARPPETTEAAPTPPLDAAAPMPTSSPAVAPTDRPIAPPEPPKKSAPWWRTRRIIVVPAALILLLVILGSLGQRDRAATPGATNAPIDDHGNTAQNGTPITLPATASGTIEPAGDVDVFNVVLRANQDLQAELRLGTLADGGVTLLAPNGDQLETQNAVGNQKSVTLTYRIRDGGAYHLAVRGQRNATGTYQLVVTAR